MTDHDFVYLVDFGIARAATDPGLTQIGTTVGTYNYMAPERFTGGEVTYRADIYSLACVLGECLTGAPPYRADSIERLIAAHLTDPPPRPSTQRPGSVPPAFDQVIARGMAKRPEERYRSAGELATAAHQALTGPQQDQAATIIRHGEEAAFGTETRAAPVASGVLGRCDHRLAATGPHRNHRRRVGNRRTFRRHHRRSARPAPVRGVRWCSAPRFWRWSQRWAWLG